MVGGTFGLRLRGTTSRARDLFTRSAGCTFFPISLCHCGCCLVRAAAMPLKATEIVAHSAFDTVEWDLPPTRKGYQEVARGRSGGPFKLYWEVHGEGSVKTVVGDFSLFGSFGCGSVQWH